MQRHIILIGGPHGVGKTTVTDALSIRLKSIFESVATYDPGELFWNYHINHTILHNHAIENMIKDSLVGTSQFITLVNWHYAVWTPHGYIPQIPWELWEYIAGSTVINRLELIHLTAPPEMIFERRKHDRIKNIKRRKLNLAAIETEIKQSDLLYNKHLNTAQAVRPGVRGYSVTNTSSDRTAEELATFLT
ncbi:AAA family ATPase [Candidatus Jorgensenbacteria bacterium]|nr:AAA family ATPase [Candidatus Jorgensenbacteria bacterium]